MFIAPINIGFDSEPQEGTWTLPQAPKLSVHPLEMISLTSDPPPKELAGVLTRRP